MASKAKKLASGSYRALVSWQDETGKRRYKSFTAPTKKEAEYAASAFELEKRRYSEIRSLTLGEAMDRYIEEKRPILSPTTIHGYERTRRLSFQDIINRPIDSITTDDLVVAVRNEMNRPTQWGHSTQSPKSVKNAYGLVSAVLARYMPERTYRVDMPRVARKIRTLPSPEQVYDAVKGTDIELACLLAMWLSFSMSEIRGLTKSKSIDGDYITIREVMVRVGNTDVLKPLAKTDTRNRRHRLPPYLKDLIEQVEGDVIVPYLPNYILKSMKRYLSKKRVPEISFHDLRHISASVMAMLHIPDKYAQERGGWSTDSTMKRVYIETFSAERQRVDDMVDSYFGNIVSADKLDCVARNVAREPENDVKT